MTGTGRPPGRPARILAALAVGIAGLAGPAPAAAPPFSVKALDAERQTAVISGGRAGGETRLRSLERIGAWTLMAVLEGGPNGLAAFEDLADEAGSLVFIGPKGVSLSLAKSLAATTAPPGTLYRGRTLDEIVSSPKDLLSSDILAKAGDPSAAEVAACLPPLRIPTFVGTNRSLEKVLFEYGAASINYIDAGKIFPEIAEARARRDVREGLVGGWFHAPRFVFPSGAGRYWEEVVFATEDPSKSWTQPVRYRVILVERGQVREAHYYDSHLPYPPRGEPPAREFYAELLRARAVMERALAPAMTVAVPDATVSDFCRHALSMELVTRTGDHPRYGYPPIHQQSMFKGFIGSGFSNVDSFQDTFTAAVSTFLDWGLADAARRFIDDYFTEFVRDDGSIDTRGPEIGQYGRMLTVLARYGDYTGDDALLLKHERKILAIADLLAGLRAESLRLPPADPAYGILSGWSEHDSGLQTDPYRFILPHFSNSAEAARGFHDLGRTLAAIGRRTSDTGLLRTAETMGASSDEMRRDLAAAVERSVDRNRVPPYVPAVAGDMPTLWKNRAYAEMLASGVLPKSLVEAVAASQSANGETLLEVPRSGNFLNGFVVYGRAYGLLQHDMVREFLLFYHAHRAHLYSRGTWTAVEGASVDGEPLSTFCTPAQLTIPALTKWMLVFEDPDEPVVWLAKATPRSWLEDGKRIAVGSAPTRFGRIDYALRSGIGSGRVSGTVKFPSSGFGAEVRLRLRVPGPARMKKVFVNGAPWKAFDGDQEAVRLPAGLRGDVAFEVVYK